MKGSIHNIIRLVDSCCGLAAGMADIFCISHMELPTRIGSRSGMGLSLEYLPRSIHRNLPSSGTAS